MTTPDTDLKAHGCENIIYVTRKGEESKFAQGVFMRLTKSDQKTWSDLYNFANPKSSITRSYMNATQIKCTNWNQFDIKKGMNDLVKESMQAPMTAPADCR